MPGKLLCPAMRDGRSTILLGAVLYMKLGPLSSFRRQRGDLTPVVYHRLDSQPAS
jgi:hypothetical protein